MKMFDQGSTAGWVKISRSLLQWEWYGDTPCVRLALHLILRANYQARRWEGITVERGQLVTTRSTLSAELHLTDQQLRTALSKLERSEFLTRRATKSYTLITICNYESYQHGKSDANQDANPALTNDQPTINQPSTNDQPIEKKNKKYKERKESLSFACAHATSAERETFFEIFFFRNFQKPAYEVERFCANYEASGWIRKNGQPVVDRRALALTWTQEEKNAAPRFDAAFLSRYKELYAAVRRQNPEAAAILVTDLQGVALGAERIDLACTARYREVLERNMAFFRPLFFDRHYPGRAIHYRVPRKNHHAR